MSFREVGEADRLLHAGHYQEALDVYLKLGASARALVRNHMLSALAQTLASMGSCDNEAGVSSASGGSVDWDTLSVLAKRVYSLCGDDDVAMTMLGVKCLDEGMHEQAKFFLSTAILADQECLIAKENLHVLYDRMVNRWHFHMLNDIQRNSAYSKALHLALQTPHCTVLDIGSGTGILSMMAARSGAESVYAVEVNRTMVAMSGDILAANGMSERVKLLHSLSTSLSVPRDIPQRVNLVVTEIVDAGLLGEHIIPTLRHAWKELLLPPTPAALSSHTPGPGPPAEDHTILGGGNVIPAGATVYAMGIECQEIRRKSQLLLCNVAGVSLESVRLEGSCKAGEDGETGSGPTGVLVRELYSCERLNHIRGGATPLTLPQPVLHFDFNHPEVSLPANHSPLAVTQGGKLDAIAVWFDLHLFADVVISTSPSWDLSWEQAIFPVTTHTEWGAGMERKGVESGDVILLHASCSDTSLFMEVEEVERAQVEVTAPRITTEPLPVFYVERNDLLRVNDSFYASSYQQALVKVLEVVRQEESDSGADNSSVGSESSPPVADCLLLDLCHGLPLFGLAAAKLGADFVQVAHCNPAYQALLEHLAASNQVAACVSIQRQDVRRHHSRQLVWDVVVCDIISPQGTIQEGIFEKLAHIRATQLCSTSVLIPSKVRIEAILLSSPTLRAQSSVLGTVPTLGFDIAPFINHYLVTHFVDVDLSGYPMQPLSTNIQLMEVDLRSLNSEPLKLNCAVPVEVTADGSITGVAYWFTFCLFGDITFSTAPGSYQQSHWHQSVFMLPEDLTISKGDMVTVHGLLRDSCIDIYILD